MPSRPGSLRLTLTSLTAAALVLGACGGTSARSRGSATTSTPPTSATTAAPTTTTTAAAASEWTTYGGSELRDSADTSEAPLSAAPGRAWSSPNLDGVVYGQPLIYGGRVYVATENDTVYALAASDGAVVWSDHLGTPAPAGALPCGDISPTVGVTSTMVIDPSGSTLYASAELWNGSSVSHALFPISTGTGTVHAPVVLDRPGWSAAAQLQRAGLALDQGNVLVGFGGNYGDCGQYHGWLVAVSEASGAVHAYQVPTANEGAIWGPSGPAVDSAGDIFVATGNGSARQGQAFDHGDAVIQLSPSLTETQYFAPANWPADNASDGDLGSTNPVLLGDGRLFEVGKESTGYLLHASSLGGVGAAASTIGLCSSRGANAYLAPDLYVVCPDSGTIVSVAVGPGDTLTRRWTWHSPTGGASSPTLARGRLWVIDLDAQMLYAVDPASGATDWSLALDTGIPPHFASPAAGEGLLVVAGSRSVEAFR